jgi:trk system potassium uptake protein TrkH
VFRSRLQPNRGPTGERKWFWRWFFLKKAVSNPYVLLVLSFLAVIGFGSILLAQPWATRSESLSWTNACFTSTSAVCVTGLTVKSTGQEFTFLGQVTILALIQFGGLGFMTLSTMMLLRLRKKASLYEQGYLRDYYGADTSERLPDVTRRVGSYIAWMEGIGSLLLFVRFAIDKPGGVDWLPHLVTSLWSAFFHSVSAFCNAGFSLWDDSLIRYSGDLLVNLVIMSLVLSGGLGFFVLADIHEAILNWWIDAPRKLRFQTRLVLTATAFLIIGGALLLAGLEYCNSRTVGERPWHQSLLISLFQSVTCRTAGFNTVDLNALVPPSILVMMVLMFIGAAPGGTGGGVKVTTFWVLLSQLSWVFHPAREPSFRGRSFNRATIRNAVSLTVCALLLVLIGVTLLLLFEQRVPRFESRGLFLDALFEVVSALGTVGLSMGLTPTLSDPGKWVLVVLMFLGRVGPLGLLSAALDHEEYDVRYPSESVSIG